ncbi:MAG: bifunctional folylpolyglutamate synthase/dihydrofolate synthase [Deinococcales bacterium]
MTRPEPDDIIAWLQGRQRFGVRLGLERMRRLLETLGHPERTFRSALVAGTNGKGSTAAVLAAALAAEGARVGLTTSPHLLELTERVLVDGMPVDDEALRGALRRVREPAEQLDATFFEIVTAAAMLSFAEAGVDTAVLEVGLGGRFDATNVVDPALSLITGIALDHTAVLGDTVAQIAREKAGILRPGRVAWTGAEGEALRCLLAEAEAVGAPLRALRGEVDLRVTDRGWGGLELTLTWPEGELVASTPLVGRHQARNVALALVGAIALGVSPEAAVQGAASARWPGRLERIPYRGCWLVLDGAHNPEAAKALAGALGRLEGRVPVLVLGVSADKDVAGMADVLAGVAEHVIATRAGASPRAMAPAALAPLVGAAEAVDDAAEALERARQRAGAGGTIVVAGSLFLVGEVRALALGEMPEPGERWQ